MVISVGHCALELQLAKICKFKKYGVLLCRVPRLSTQAHFSTRAHFSLCGVCGVRLWGETVKPYGISTVQYKHI